MKRVDEVKAKKAVLLSKRYDMLNKVFNESMVKPAKWYSSMYEGDALVEFKPQPQEVIYIFGESTIESDNWPLAES